MYKNSINNQCFEPSTLFQYKTEFNGQIYTKSLVEIFVELQENPDMIMYVPVVSDICRKDSEDKSEKRENGVYGSTVMWQEARLCETQSSQCVTIVVDRKPDVNHTELECGRIRVTPNHVFVVEKDGVLKEEEAYLVEEGEKILFDGHRVYAEDESPLFISEDGEIAAEDLLSEGTEHTVDTVPVKKCSVAKNYNKKKPWTFYGIVLTNSADKYVLMPTGLISHDSSVTY